MFTPHLSIEIILFNASMKMDKNSIIVKAHLNK